MEENGIKPGVGDISPRIDTTFFHTHTPFKSQLIIGDFLRLRIHRLNHFGSVRIGFYRTEYSTLHTPTVCIMHYAYLLRITSTEFSSMNTAYSEHVLCKSSIPVLVLRVLLYYCTFVGCCSTTPVDYDYCRKATLYSVFQ